MRAAVTVALLLGLIGSQATRPPARKPNILLITLDTTRADRMGFLGSTRGLTPNLDALAHEAVVFTQAFAQAPITTVSHATLLTGTFPPAHRVSDFGSPLPATAPYLPQLLHDAGYRTGAFVGSLILDPRNGTAPGFDRGFDVYDAGFRLQRPGESRYATVERRGDDVVGRAIKWIAAAPGTTAPGTAPTTQHSTPNTSTPWFLWVHLFDAHDPYDPPADLQSRFAVAPYDGEIAAADRAAARAIRAAGPDAMVIVAADHGEALGDHGEDTHGVFLYDAVLHVPLVMRLPARASAGSRVNARVRLADVAPTVLEAAGLTAAPAMQGASLLKGPTTDRPVYAETEYPRRAFGWSPLAAWRADRFLLVRAPAPELYDVVADPAQSHNLASSRARVVDGMSAELEQFITKSGSSTEARSAKADGSAGPGGSGQARMDPEVARRLAALGYVGGTGAPPQTGVDPKDRIAIANALHHAVVFVEDGAFVKAIPLLENVVAAEPNIPLAQLQLGIARARQRQYAQAVAPLTKAAALEPEQMLAQYELGVVLYETGDLQNAAKRFEVVAAKMPKFADARYSLGSVYARIDRIPAAERELHAAIDLEARHFRANLLLGRILTLQNKREQALPYLRTAVDVDPASAEARAFLADALKRRD